MHKTIDIHRPQTACSGSIDCKEQRRYSEAQGVLQVSPYQVPRELCNAGNSKLIVGEFF